MIKIVTHWQTFHIDELFAIAFLKMYVDNKVQITRTRDESILSAAKNDPDTWVLDVGGEYNPEMKNFDHHQSTFGLKWEDGTPFSTCGLVWNYLKQNKYLNQHMNNETMKEIEERIIMKVDKQDNGIEFWKEAFFIGIFNRKTDNEEQNFKQFLKALNATEDFYKNLFGIIRQNMKSEKEVIKVVEKSKQYDDIIVMDSNDEATFNKLNEHTDKVLAVIPYRGKDTFKIQSISFIGNSYSMKCPMPKEWNGLSGEELEKVSGVKGMVFSHKSGFMCVFNGTKEEAIKLAQQVVMYNKVFNKK